MAQSAWLLIVLVIGTQLSCETAQTTGAVDLVAVPISQQLKDTSDKVTTLGQNIQILSRNIETAIKYTEKAKDDVDTIVMQAKGAVRNYKVYVTLATNIAKDQDKSHCSSGSSEAVTEVEEQVSSKIDASAFYYLQSFQDILKELEYIKLSLVKKETKDIIDALNECVNNKTARQDQISKCLQWTAAAYKELIVSSSVKIATAYNKALFLKKTTGLKVLRSTVDTSVSLSSNDMTNYAEEILQCSGMSAKAILSKASEQFDQVNATASAAIQLAINELKQLIQQTKNKINLSYSGAEPQLKELVADIYTAITFITKRKPELADTLDAYRNRALDIISQSLGDLNTGLTQIRSSLDKISDDLDGIYVDFQTKISQSRKDMEACIPVKIEDRLTYTKSIKECTNKQVNISVEIANNSKLDISQEKDKYSALDSVSQKRLDFKVEFSGVKPNVADVVEEMLVKSGLSEQILLAEAQNKLGASTKNASDFLRGEAEQLKNSIAASLNALSLELIKANEYNANIDKLAGQAINFADKHAPEYVAEIKQYLSEAQQVVSKFKSDAEPVTNQLQAIATNVANILGKLQESQENVLVNLKKCLANENTNRFANIDYVIACLHGYENVADSIFVNAKHQLDVEIEKYQSLPDISPAYKTNADLQEILRKIENTIDKIISEKNFDYDQMVERAKQKIDQFNTTYGIKIQSGVANLSNIILEALDGVKVKINEAEQLLSELIIYPIASTVRYSIDYAPDKGPELKTFYLHSNEMLNNYIAKIKSDALPFSIQYQAILDQIRSFYPNLQELFQKNKESLSACKEERGDGRLGKVEAVDACLNRFVNASRDAAKQTETKLSNNKDLYLASGKVTVTVEVDDVKKDVDLTISDVLKVAGLTPAILLSHAQSAFLDLKAKFAIPIERGVKELKNNAQSMQNQISLEIGNIDSYINKVLNSISNTIKFAEKYSPNNVEPLKSYLNQTENLVTKIKTDLKPINPKLAVIIDTIANLSTSLNSQIEDSENNANKCVESSNPDPLRNIEEVRKCLDKQVNTSRLLAEHIKSVLSREYDTFSYISTMGSYVTGNLSFNLGSIFNGVNDKVDFIIEQEKLAPEVQLQTALEDLQVVNLTAEDALLYGIQSLHKDITNSKNRLINDLSTAETSLNEVIKPVSNAIEFATKYRQLNTAELKAYQTKADELVFGEMLKLKTTVNPALIELDDILNDSSDIIGNLQNKIDLANKSLSACPAIKEGDRLTRIESVKLCLSTHMNAAIAATDEAQAKLQRETERFQKVSNTRLVVDLDPTRANVKTIVDSVLTAAGLNDAEILRRAEEELTSINTTNIAMGYRLIVAAEWLKDAFAQVHSQIEQGAYTIDTNLKNTIDVIQAAIYFASKYGSDKEPILKAFISNVTEVGNAAKTELQTIHPKIDDSLNSVNASIVNYQIQFKNGYHSINLCAETDIVDRIARAKNVAQCAEQNVETVRLEMAKLVKVFNEEQSKYYSFAANTTNLLNNVKSSFNETINLVDKILDDLIASAGLSPESQQNKGVLSLTSIQVTGNPDSATEKLRNTIVGYMKDIDAVQNQAETALKQITFTDEAINYAIEYDPNKLSELNALRTEKEELLKSVLNDIKNIQEPVKDKLQQILQTINDNNITFHEKIADIDIKIRSCINTTIEDELDRLAAIDTCINNYLNIARNVSDNATQVLSKQAEIFKQLANVNVAIDLNKVITDLQNITNRAFEIAGLVPDVLLKKKLQELVLYNETVAKDLNRGIENLSRNIFETQDELTATLGVADKYLNEITVNATVAIDFAAKFAPEKIADFQELINEAQKIVLKAKTDIQPAKIQLQSIQNIIDSIYPDLQSRLNQTKANILNCPREDAFLDLSALTTFVRCFNTNYDVLLNAGKVSKERLNEEEKKFDLIDNVSASLNKSLNADFEVVIGSIVKQVGDVIMTYGLSPGALKRKGLEQVERVGSQVNSTLKDGIQDLQLSVDNTLNQIQKAVNNSEKALNQAVKIIGIAIDYAAEYNPDNATELEKFRQKAKEIVSSFVQDIANSLMPVYSELNSVFENKDDILKSFQSKIDQAKQNMSLCANDKTEDRYEKVENIQLCIKQVLNKIVDEANNAQRGVYDRYEKYRSIGNISIKADTDAASKRAAQVVADVLKTAGLTGEQLQNKTFEQISSINDTVAVSLMDDINKLKNSVANLQTQTSQAVKTAESYLENTTKFIQEAKEFVLHHSPDRLQELESLLNQAQLLVVKVKADAQPEEAQLQAIYNTAGLIYDNFQLQVEGTRATANTCENNNTNQLEQVTSVRNCLGSYVNTIISAANNANGQLNNEIKRFNVVANTANNSNKNISTGFEKHIAGVKEIVDSIVANQQLTPEELYNKTVNELKYINESTGKNILAGVDALKSDIARTNNDINDKIANIKINLDGAVSPIELGIQELVKYALDKTAEIIAFRERAKEIKENAITNLEMNIQPTKTLLQSIYDSLDGIYSGLNAQLELSKANVDSCYANQKENYIENIEYLRACFNNELNLSSNAANKKETDLKNELSKYAGIGNISLILTVDFGSVNVTVNSTVFELKRVSGLTPGQLLGNTKTQVDLILSNNGSTVRNDIVNVLNFVASRQNEIQGAAKNAEIQMKQEVQPVEGAINFAGKYAPDRVTQLNNYLNSGQELVVNYINKLNADVQPSINALANISTDLSQILRNYDTEVAAIKDTLKQCIEIENVDAYESIPVIQRCFKNYIDKTNTVVKSAQESLVLLTQKFSAVSSTASTVVANIDLQPLTRSVQQVINDIFETAGFTLAELPKKLVLQLEKEFDNEVVGDKLRSQELTNDVVSITDSYVNSFNRTLDWSLEPIKKAIETIKYVNPNYNTNDLSNQWRLLYDQLKGTITDYIKGIEKNATDHNFLAVGYNLNVEFLELQQNIANCIKKYTNAYLPYISDCIDPLIREFNSYVTNALNKTRNIVDEIEEIKTTAPRLIEEFINKTAERARVNASVTAEAGKAVASITPNEQIKRFLTELDELKKNGINVFISDINSLIRNVKNGNLSAFIDLTAKLEKAAEPWLYAINITTVNNPSKAAELSAQLPIIKKIVDDAKQRIKNELAQFIIEAVDLENKIKVYQSGVNSNLTKFNAQLILTRCSAYNFSVMLFADCVRNITSDLYNYLRVVQPELNIYLDSAVNISKNANAAINDKLTLEFNATKLLSLNEGGKVIQTYNISNNHILVQSLQSFKSYNVTPIQNNIISVRNHAARIISRTQDMVSFANYTLRSATYVINDAIGSAIYVLLWRKTFNAERDEGIRIATEAANKVLATIPDFTSHISLLQSTANRMNDTLESEIAKLEPAQLSVSCPITMDFYDMYKCLLAKVDAFGAYYTPALRESYSESIKGFSSLSNITLILNKWRDEVIYIETAVIVNLMKPLAQALFINNNIRIDQLLGYGLYLIRNKYSAFNQTIPNAAYNLKVIANRILVKNYTGRVDLTEPANLLLKPVTDTLLYLQTTNLYHLLNETDLQIAHTLLYELNYKLYHIFYANFSIQAQLAIQLADYIQADVERTYLGLDYNFLYSTCYDEQQAYALVEMTNCFTVRYSSFAAYLTNSLKNLTTTASVLLNFDMNEERIVNDYVNNKLLPEFRQISVMFAIELYYKVGLKPPAEYIAMVSKKELCRVGIITDKFTCIITQ